MQKSTLKNRRNQRKVRWCHKMEKKLAVIVDNNEEVTTKNEDRKMCSSACDGAMEMYSSECPDTCGDGSLHEQEKFEAKGLCRNRRRC